MLPLSVTPSVAAVRASLSELAGFSSGQPSTRSGTVKRHIESAYKMQDGENIRVDVPCFVEVAVDAAGWGDYGPYISGSIVKGSPSSGISDVIGVEEIGWS